MANLRRSTETEKFRAELEESRPYLGLACEIHDEIQRIVDDPASGVELVSEAIDRWPREARLRAAERAFEALSPERQWEILAELFDDDELRAALNDDRGRRLLEARRQLERSAVVHAVRDRQALDTREVAADEELSLGLFREVDVRSALAKGATSTTCARRLVLRATGVDGELLVLEDVFNPARGLFVTAEYDERTWLGERLAPHSLVRVGSIHEVPVPRASDVQPRFGTAGAPAPSPAASSTAPVFHPIVYPGGRLDIEMAGAPRRGHLHAGYASIGDVELFTHERNQA